jgi:hypothetical protein
MSRKPTMTAKLRLAGLVIGALTLCCAGTHQQECMAQPTNYLDMLKGLYAFESWAGHTKAHYQHPVTNWVPDFASIGVTNFVVRDEGVWTNFQKYSDYLFHPPDAPATYVKLGIVERQDVTNAHLAMLENFQFAAAPQPFPLGLALGIDIGDRCYLGWGVVGGSVDFVRNNVFVSLSATDYSVIKFGEQLDSELTAKSFKGPVLLHPSVSERTFHVSVATAAGKNYILEYRNSLAGTNWSAFPRLSGDGTIRTITTPLAPVPQQFYRLRVE